MTDRAYLSRSSNRLKNYELVVLFLSHRHSYSSMARKRDLIKTFLYCAA
jgi:hypothetical protein